MIVRTSSPFFRASQSFVSDVPPSSSVLQSSIEFRGNFSSRVVNTSRAQAPPFPDHLSSRCALSCVGTTSHMRLLSIRNMTSSDYDVLSVKYTPDCRDLV